MLDRRTDRIYLDYKEIENLPILIGLSKSYVHRTIILAYVFDRDIIIRDITFCDDTKLTLNALYDDYEIKDNDLYLYKKNKRKDFSSVNVGESGSTLRFLIPVLSGDKMVRFVGKKSLFSRPLDYYEEVYNRENLKFKREENSLIIMGRLGNNKYFVPTDITSQYASGMLMASLIKENNFEVEYKAGASSQYIDITNHLIYEFKNGKSDFNLPKDASTFAFYYALFSASENYNKLKEIENIDFSYQKDGDIKELLNNRDRISLKNNIDLTPVIAAYYGVMKKKIILSDLKNLIYKESNRLFEIIRVLEIFGIDVREKNGSLYINFDKKKEVNGDITLELNDHRIIHMALICALKLKKNIFIIGIENLKKSHKELYDYLINKG